MRTFPGIRNTSNIYWGTIMNMKCNLYFAVFKSGPNFTCTNNISLEIEVRCYVYSSSNNGGKFCW